MIHLFLIKYEFIKKDNNTYTVHRFLFSMKHWTWCDVYFCQIIQILWMMNTVSFRNSSVHYLLCHSIVLCFIALQYGFSIQTKPWNGNEIFITQFSFPDFILREPHTSQIIQSGWHRRNKTSTFSSSNQLLNA